MGVGARACCGLGGRAGWAGLGGRRARQAGGREPRTIAQAAHIDSVCRRAARTQQEQHWQGKGRAATQARGTVNRSCRHQKLPGDAEAEGCVQTAGCHRAAGGIRQLR